MSYIGTQPNDVKKNTGLYTPSEILQLTKDGSWGGSLELIEEQTISSAVASLDFTSIKGNQFDVHLLEIANIIPATDSQPTYLRFSNDSGSSFEAGTSYQYAFQNGGYGSGTFEEHKSTGTSAINLTNNTGNATNETINLYCYIYNANNSSKYTFASYQGVFMFSTGEMVMMFGGGVYPTAETINAFQILKASGNMTQGFAKLYGVKQI